MASLLGEMVHSKFTCIYKSVVGFSSLLTTGVTPQLSQPLIQTRTKATKQAAAGKNQGNNRRRKGKRFGPKVHIDQFVQPGQILFRQRGFKMHPGRNVDYARDKTLFAVREGFVKVSQEVLENGMKWTEKDEEGPLIERTFMHIVERPYVRRLVCLNPQSLANVKL